MKKKLGAVLLSQAQRRFEQALDQKNRREAKFILDRTLARYAGAALPSDAAHMQAQWFWESDGPRAAEAAYRQILVHDAHDSDAHHALGVIFSERGDHAQSVAHFRTVLMLDAQELSTRCPPWIETQIADRVQRLLAKMPAELAQRLESVPIVIEERPSPALVEEGVDPRSLGLFEGNDLPTTFDASVAPTRVVLFAANLYAAFPSLPTMLREVDTTVLHELGHYLGLDEAEVEALGLG